MPPIIGTSTRPCFPLAKVTPYPFLCPSMFFSQYLSIHGCNQWVNIIKTSPLLAETLAHKPIIAVNNGSYKDTQGKAAWVICTDLAPSTAISQGTLTTPGHSDTQGSYRSELAGIYSIITTISIVSQFYQITHGTVQVICNGKSALQHCFKQQVCNLTEKHFNIIYAICTTMQNMSLTW